MALNTNKKTLSNKKSNPSTKKYDDSTLNNTKSTSMRISADVKQDLENIQFDIMNENRIRVSLSETVQILIDSYKNKK